MAEGLKYDEGKLRYDLIPHYPIEMLAAVLTFGATKYGDWNWSHGIPYLKLIASCSRHFWSFVSCDDVDKESGLPHLAHLMCNVAMLLHFTKYRPDLDNRPNFNPVK